MTRGTFWFVLDRLSLVIWILRYVAQLLNEQQLEETTQYRLQTG